MHTAPYSRCAPVCQAPWYRIGCTLPRVLHPMVGVLRSARHPGTYSIGAPWREYCTLVCKCNPVCWEYVQHPTRVCVPCQAQNYCTQSGMLHPARRNAPSQDPGMLHPARRTAPIQVHYNTPWEEYCMHRGRCNAPMVSMHTGRSTESY